MANSASKVGSGWYGTGIERMRGYKLYRDLEEERDVLRANVEALEALVRGQARLLSALGQTLPEPIVTPAIPKAPSSAPAASSVQVKAKPLTLAEMYAQVVTKQK